MDSLSQFALGAAVGVAVMGRRTALWKSALWGGIAGTLPDLDAFIDHGDPIANMTLHRAESHALFWQTLASPLIATLIVALQREWPLWKRWWLAVWLALVTHPLLDAMTVYGTQLLLPFSDHPFGVGSIFIIDPLYTLPLLVGTGAALRAGPHALRWNAAGLALSCAYLAWSFAAQQHVRGLAVESLRAQGLPADRVLVTPAPFNTLLWRIVAVGDDRFHEGFYSLLDDDRSVAFDAFARGGDALTAWREHAPVERLARFAHGFVKLVPVGDTLRLSDLRMGQEPAYVFTFVVAQRDGGAWRPVPTQHAGMRPDLGRAFAWLGRRVLGEAVAPPR